MRAIIFSALSWTVLASSNASLRTELRRSPADDVVKLAVAVAKVADQLAQRNDPTNQKYVKNWAAIGDSYAAGIGSGNALDLSACARYDQSYPSMLYDGLKDNQRNFQYTACSGAVTSQVIEQLKNLEVDQDVITISSGGNDVGLVDLLNSCVYLWMWWGESCEKQIKLSWDLINSEEFSNNLTTLARETAKFLNTGKRNRGNVGRAFWTGYAQFFNNETTQCNDVTFAFWDPNNLFDAEKLTQGKRTDLNDMVVAVNDKIKKAIKDSGELSKLIQYVDMDEYVREIKGRFCEEGVKEPDTKREITMFYNTGTKDYIEPNPGKQELKREALPLGSTSHQGRIVTWVDEAKRREPKLNSVFALKDESSNKADVEYSNEITVSNNGVVTKSKASKSVQEREGSIKVALLPRHVTRVFHPRPFMHKVLKDLVTYWMADDRAAAIRAEREPLYQKVITVERDSPKPEDPPKPKEPPKPEEPKKPKDDSDVTTCTDGIVDPKDTYSDNFGKAAAEWFCNRDMPQGLPGQQGTFTSIPYGFPENVDMQLLMRLRWIDGKDCRKRKGMRYKPDKAECVANFEAAMTGCQETDKRAGSYKMWNKGDDGCVVYELMPCPGKEAKNPNSDKCRWYWGKFFDNTLKVDVLG